MDLTRLLPLFLMIFSFSAVSLAKTELSTYQRTDIKFNQANITSEFEFDNGLPIVNLSIQGKPYRFLFDTGAVSTIDLKLAQQLNLPVQALPHLKAMDANGATSNIQGAVIPSLDWHGLTINNLGVAVFDLNPANGLFSCIKLDGILGYNLISLLPGIKIDYQQRQLTLSSRPQTFAKDAAVIPIELKAGSGPILRLHFNQAVKNVPVILDTGKNAGLSLPIRVGQELQKAEQLVYPVYPVFSQENSALFTQQANQSFLTRIDNVYLSHFKIDNMVVDFNQGMPLLGNDFFRQYTVSINWQQRRIGLIPNGEVRHAEDWSTFGLYPTFDAAQGVVVGRLLPTVSKAMKQIRVGDKIVQVENNDTSTNPLESVCFMSQNKYKAKQNPTINLTLERNHQQYQLTLERKYLFRHQD